MVDEATYQPVDSATVSLVGADATVTTGRWGAFAFPDAPLGQVVVQVSAPGHPSMRQEVEVREDRMAYVRVVLPSVTAVLSELLVRGRSAARPGDAASTAADLVAIRVPRTRVASGDVGNTDYPMYLRPGTSFTGNTEPLIVIDGIAITRDAAFDALERIPAADVEEIEVLKGPAAAFLYPYGANGVIIVTTKRGVRIR